MDPKLRALSGQGLKSPASRRGRRSCPCPLRRGRDGLQEVGKVQGAGGEGSLETQTRAERVLQVATGGAGGRLH